MVDNGLFRTDLWKLWSIGTYCFEWHRSIWSHFEDPFVIFMVAMQKHLTNFSAKRMHVAICCSQKNLIWLWESELLMTEDFIYGLVMQWSNDMVICGYNVEWCFSHWTFRGSSSLNVCDSLELRYLCLIIIKRIGGLRLLWNCVY